MNAILEELDRNGISVCVMSPRYYNSFKEQWNIMLKKTVNGTAIEVIKYNTNLTAAVVEAYETWIALTQNAPGHNLKQIECRPAPQTDPNEIPF